MKPSSHQQFIFRLGQVRASLDLNPHTDGITFDSRLQSITNESRLKSAYEIVIRLLDITHY